VNDSLVKFASHFHSVASQGLPGSVGLMPLIITSGSKIIQR
jgi:hypothetical protein